MVEISTSILSVEKEGAIRKFYDLEAAHTDYFHIDVMDGKFVEKNTEETMLEYVQAIRQISNIPLDIHFMVKNVEKYVEEYIPFEPNIITFHYEAIENEEEIKTIISKIKDNNIKVGISIKPDTKVEKIYNILPYIHMVLIMTVQPGKGGQKLIPETVNKIKELREYIEKNNMEIDIEVDGGINEETIKIVKDAGADIAVVGSAIIDSNDYKAVINKLKNII